MDVGCRSTTLITWVISKFRLLINVGSLVLPVGNRVRDSGGAMPVSVLAAPALLMTMTDIAELAEVQRPVVTTWRRRYPDFPRPAGGDEAQPQFDPREVADWLLTTGRVDRDQHEQELACSCSWSRGHATRARTPSPP